MSPSKHYETPFEVETKKRRKRWIALFTTIGVAIPALTGAWAINARLVAISDLPGRLDTEEKNRWQLQQDFIAYKAATDAKLDMIIESQHRIEHALHTDPARETTKPDHNPFP